VRDVSSALRYDGAMGDVGTVSFDESAWPVVVMRCPVSFSKDSPHDIIDGFERMMSRNDHFAVIIDATPVKTIPNAAWRKTITDWANAPHTQRKTARYSVGTVMIMPSPLARGIYTAISWVVKHTSPQYAAANMADAVSWCCERLIVAGVPRSRALVELQRSQRLIP
jgi:hypothetical protein